MNSLIRISILWSLAISIGGAQDADTPKDESSPAVPVPALEQAANEAVSEDDKRIVVVLGPDATPSEDEQAVNIQKAFDSLKERKLPRFSTPEDDPKKVIVTLGFRKEDSAESIENLLIDLWQLDIPGLTVSLRTGATIQIETGDGCYAQISNFEDLDRRQIIDLWEFFQKPERKQKFDALFHSGSHAYSKPSVPPPHPASPSTVSLKVERGLARNAIEITRSLEKKGGLVSLGVDEEANAILVDSRDGFLEEARVLLRKWQNYYHPVRIADGKTAGAEPTSVSASNTEVAPASSKAIVLVIDADAQKSEVVREVIAALEKAGIATGKTAETAPPANSSISVTLNMRKDESYDKIKQLVEALKRAGVQQMSIRAGGVTPEGEDEQNTLILDAQPGHATDELHKIENAARYAAKKCGLSLVVSARGVEGGGKEDDSALPEKTQSGFWESVDLPWVGAQPIGLRLARAQLRNAQLKLAKLRLQYSDQHPSVKALELEIQAMESQLQPREELLDTLQGVRSELVEKNETARKENGSQNTETARLEALIAQLDARIKSVEGALEPAPEKVARVKVFALKYAQATDTAEVLKQVYDRGPLKIVPDARTNSVIVTGPEAQVQEIEALLLKLDEAQSAANTDTNLPAPVEHMEYKETHPKFVPLNVEDREATSEESKQQLAQLQTDYEAANKQAHDLATLLRDRSGGRVDDQLKAQNEQKIEKSLQQKVSLHFRNAPFTEVIREISKSHGINIVMKTREIGTEGLPTGRPISIDVEEITLGSALTLLLDQAGGLEYHIENEVLMITNGGEPKPAVDDDVENIDNMAAKKAELRTAVRRAFTLRQSLLRAELQEMQARLEKTQQSIDMRERIADQIVDRRVEDLLNPELKWEGSPQFAPAEDFNTAVSGSSSPPAPIGLGLPEEIDAGAWGEPQNGLRLAIVVKSENSLWNKAQEVQYVVENVSKEKIALRGQRNDQLATLFEVRQTSQAQVQTMPRVNSGVQETGSDIELGPGERAVIARVWMGVVEKQTDAIPDGDPQLLIIDSDAWKFRNKIYVARGCLQPDPDQPTVTIRSGQVAIAFHKPADTSIGSLPASSPAMHVGETRFSDPKESLLAALQGVWDLQSHTNPGDPPDPKIKHLDVEIKGNLMTLWISTDTQRIQAWSAVLKLGEPGPPQQIDITFDPNDGEDRMETFGLIETSDDLVRICLDHSSESQRPEVFAVGARSEIWELRRKPAVSSASELEGDWKLESYALKDGTTQDLSLAYAPQLEIRGNEVFYDSGRNPSKIEINPTQKTLSYQKDSEKAPSLYRYSLGPDQLTLRDAGQSVLVYRRQAAPPSTALATELEGDWHVVAYYDHEGKLRETLPSNRSFGGDQSSFVGPGYRHDCRIKVDPIKKTLWSYSREGDGSFGQDYYELKGNQLILRNEPDAVGYQVFERGLVRIPSVVPQATLEQKLLWRSAIVEIVASTVGGQAPRDRVIGRGIVISCDGKMLSQLNVNENGDLSAEKITARFDDGSVIPLKLIEKAGQGWSVLQPEQPISVNYYFEFSTTEVQLHDEVRVWGPDHSQAGSESLAPFANTVSALDRKYPALGIAVWQLRIGHQPVPGTPILDADGDLLGMTITGARDLLLAIPVAELKTMFPKSFGQPSESEPQPVEALPDWLSNLQGTWTVTDSPIKVDENSGGQMKEVRIDRDQWSIVWTAKPGDPDRVESLRVIRPDEKNLYAIDLVELSTGKVVYPSLYELDQAGLTFCYGYLGKRPHEISTGNGGITIQLTRDE